MKIKIMIVFYGSAIQGQKSREERADANRALIDVIKADGYKVVTEHTTAKTYEESVGFLETAFGNLPPKGPERTRFVREKIMEAIEKRSQAAVFEVSVPSIGTGMEIEHALLRPRMGFPEIPILLLYQKGYWPGTLSRMILGLPIDEKKNLTFREYDDIGEAKDFISEFLRGSG